jgi:outer membrane lipoprotein SlyB
MITVARVLIIGACVSLTACAPAYVAGPPPYAAGYGARMQGVEVGVVEAARPVVLQGPESGAGAFGGSLLGGLAGSAAGAGAGQAAAIFGGMILGALTGSAMERTANRGPGVELTLRLDSGRTATVVQPDGGEALRPGDRVRLLSDGYAMRVVR